MCSLKLQTRKLCSLYVFCRGQGSSQSLPHCLWMSFVVWPYINNVKVMISRLKALSCLVSPLPPYLCLAPTPPLSACRPAKGGIEDDCWPTKVSQRNRGIPDCAVETLESQFCLIDYLRKRGRKRGIILRKHLFSAFPLLLKFGATGWWMRNLHCGLWCPLLFLSPYPASLPSPDTHTQSDTWC